jgi:HEAT repeat protein
LFWLQPLGLPPASAQPAEASIENTSGIEEEQLNLAREGIIDPNARPEDRHRWIDILFSYNTPPARALIVELLQLTGNPEAQRALCGGIARHARTHPDRLDKSLVEPLIELLGSSSEDLRAAASKALADFPGAEVVKELGALARRSDVAVDKRLAAIDAMVSKVDNRAVVRELMALLEADVPEVSERVVAALEPVSRETFGADLQRWRTWWAEKSQLDEEAWLADRLRLYRDSVDHLERELETFRQQAVRRHEAISARTGEFQRDVFRSLGPEQQQAKLAEWLTDPLPEVALVSLDLIKARMADVGQRPEGEVLQGLLGLLSEGTTPGRLVVLEIVQNLKNERSVVQAVLAQVAAQSQPELRCAFFKALGRLDSLEAVPTLIIEIADPHSPPECVREAAIALGHIAGKADRIEHIEDARTALKTRYGLVSREDKTLRAALLTAMSGVGDRAFAPDFLEAIESDSADLVRPGLRGLQVIGDKSKLPRLRTLTTDADPLVRVAAIEAVGKLGNQDVDLESVLTRLNPTIETNELAREAAWAAFLNLLADKPFDVHFFWSERLREMPDLEVRHLQELLAMATTVNGNGIDLEAVYDRLATVLVSQGKYADALSHLRCLYEGAASEAGPGAQEIGVRWLDAAMRAPGQVDVTDVITRLVDAAGDDEARVQIVAAVTRYLESPQMLADAERTRALLEQLRWVQSEALGDEWASMLQRVADRIEPTAEETAPSPSP